MRCACVRSLIYLLTVLASSTTLAGPLAFDPSGGARPEPSPRYRQVAAQGQYGGGFIEFLMRGGQQSSAGSHPADLGPGMVESPTQPGYLVMDPRFVKQQVSYAGQGGSRHDHHQYERADALSRGGQGPGAALRHRRRASRLYLVGRPSHHAEARMAGLDTAR